MTRKANTYRPALTVDGSTRAPRHRSLNLALVFAPQNEVTEATGGILRASENGCFVDEGDATPPIIHAEQPNGGMSLRRHVVVSTPPGADFTLVEYNYTHEMGQALSMMMPEARVITLRSNYEKADNYFHDLTVYHGGKVLRQVALDKGWTKSGLTFRQTGIPQDFETPARYEQRSLSNRLNRSVLLDMAENLGLDVETALFARNLDTPVHFAGVANLSDLNSDGDVRKRTTRFQAAHDKAVALGIGPGEEPPEQAESQAAYMERIARVGQFGNRFLAAMHRAHPDPARAWKAYQKWMAHPDRPAEFAPHPGTLTNGLDRAGDATALAALDREAELWKAAQQWSMRLIQTVADQIDGKTQDLGLLDSIMPRAVQGVNDGTYRNIEQAMRRETGAVYERLGIAFNPEGPILTEKEATRNMARFLVESTDDFVRSLNDNVTLDLRVSETTRIDKNGITRTEYPDNSA